jgi:MFS superfamily sulfate permease-like transporter
MGEALGPAPAGRVKPNGAWPVLRSLRGYRLGFLPADLVAGLSLAAIAIPAQMATAHLGGFPPQIGFFAFFAGTLGFAAFGGNRFLSCCADSTIAPIFAGSLALIVAAGSKEYALYAAALALMVGVTLIAAGLFKLGRIGDLLSIPVTIGFLVGIAVHIVISQLPGVLGAPGAMPQRAADIFGYFDAANPFTLTIALGELAMILVLGGLSARIPAALIGLVLATCAVLFFRLDAHGVAVLGTVPSALPVPSVPLPSAAKAAELVPLALIVAIVVMVQTAATTRSFPSDADTPPDIDRDFVGVGVGSVLAGLFGAFPVDASPPSTEIVAASGGRSQLACLIAATILLILLLFGAALLRHVPQAALAGVLLFVALKIVRADQIATIYRQSGPEFLLIVATAAAIILLPIGQGVAIGIGLSLIHGIWSTASGKIILFERVPGTTIWWPPTPLRRGERLAGVAVIGFDAPLSFLNADRFRSSVSAVLQSMPVKLIVLEANSISQIDFTAAATLCEIIRECHADRIDFAIARLESVRAQEAVRRFELDSALGSDRIFRSVEEAVKALAPDAQVAA